MFVIVVIFGAGEFIVGLQIMRADIEGHGLRMAAEIEAKALSRNTLASPFGGARLDFVVPVAMKFVAADLHLSHIRV